MTTRTIHLLLASCFAASLTAQDPQPDASGATGRGFAYDYVDARLVLGDLTGIGVDGSYSFGEEWFASGRLLVGSDSDVDLTTLSAGAGYRYPLAVPQGKLELVGTAELEYGSIEVSVGPFSASDSEVGLRLRGGARYRIDDRWEVRAGLGYRTIFGGEFVFDVAGQYDLNEQWSLVAELDLGSDYTLLGIGARLEF